MLFAEEDWPTRSRASHLYPTVGIPGARTVNRPVLDRGLADAQTSNTGDWIDGVIEPCRCPGRKHKPTVTSWIDKHGRRKVRGILKVLAESAAYPRRMGQRIYACHTGQYIARRPAAKSQRQQKTTTGKQPRASSARIAKTWLQPRASIHLLRPASSSPLSARPAPCCLLALPRRVTSLACGRSPVPPGGEKKMFRRFVLFMLLALASVCAYC